MTDYLHPVPGRLRVRSRALRCASAACGGILRKLRVQTGVRSVRHNAKAGSVTVCYDAHKADADAILNPINDECLQKRPTAPPSKRAPLKSDSKPGSLTAEIGRMALGALVNRGVGMSVSALLGVRG